MTRRPTKETTAGQCYLALQREGRRTGRPTDELIQLYALEGFLDRLTKSQYAENFVLKGGVLQRSMLVARRETLILPRADSPTILLWCLPPYERSGQSGSMMD
jgi:hypothetical protein